MKKGSPLYISIEFLVALALIGAALIVSLFVDSVHFRIMAITGVFAAAIVYFYISAWQKQKMVYVAARLFKKLSDRIDRYVNAASIPTVITSKRGRIRWYNPAFFMLKGMQCEGWSIFRLMPGLDKPDKERKIVIGDVVYQKESIQTELNGKQYLIFRFIDRENAHEVAELSRLAMPVVCHAQIDNFGDLLRGAPQNMHLEIESEIERVISKTADSVRAVYQRYDRDNYILVFERRYLSSLLQNKFYMLEEVRKINTGTAALNPTLSVGVGAGSAPVIANANALKALEMALGRGGDQAVMKDEAGFRYFGGIQQGRETRSKVKSRMFAKALRNLMEQCDRVVIMGHVVPDLDCMGAALGLLACARRIDRKAHIVMDKPNVSIDALVGAMSREPDYENVLITPSEADSLIDAKTMLIIVDTQIESFTIAPRLYNEATTTVVIDHHVRGNDHIENATLFLHEPYASSTSEMVTEIVEYFSERIVLKPLEVEALLAGITMDTKGFSFKTGVRTFEAASFLRRMGADTAKIRHLFQDELSTYTARAKVVENAQVLSGGVAISVCPKDIQNPQLLAAQAADSLINIRGIGASFVLCDVEGTIMISGRSLGEVNVQRILEKMGGGGHATIAGAQIKSKGMDEVVEELKAKIKEYESEVK